MKKYNPILEDERYWRYEDLVLSWSDFVLAHLGIGKSENFEISVAHLAKKLYEMGYSDAIKETEELLGKEKILN